MSLEISIRLGELGRPRHLSVEGRWVKIFWISSVIVVAGFFYFAWMVVSATRIYPQLLYQTQKSASLDARMERVRLETSRLKKESEDLERISRRLGGRFGLASKEGMEAEAMPTGQKLIELLFPDPSGAENWSREASDLGEKTAKMRRDLGRMETMAQTKMQQLEQTPSIIPTRGQLCSGFGWRLHPVFGEYILHEGQDITGPVGMPVVATASGSVATREYSSSFGNYVVVAHGGGVKTLYAHLSAFKCELGDKVRRGQVIGLLGNTGRSTGPHVHYEVHLGERTVDPTNWILPTTLVP